MTANPAGAGKDSRAATSTIASAPGPSQPALASALSAGAARQGFETERAGSGKGVEHRPPGEGQPLGGKPAMRQNIEQGLASPVAGRPHRLARRRDQPTAAMHAADDPQPP